MNRLLDAALGGRDVLSGARVLSGNPVLKRSEPVLAGTDPLDLALARQHRPGSTPASRTASSGDHGAPERERFCLPTPPTATQAPVSKEGRLAER
ncbi:hypothetical protein [Trinickia fusca]|uniref:hypothetical protein n=1 Tax=Trinickia fusca TaxID=2419777 RepID=UPI001C7DC5E7|nr:hypothetical protein [Trinickia fusca]